MISRAGQGVTQHVGMERTYVAVYSKRDLMRAVIERAIRTAVVGLVVLCLCVGCGLLGKESQPETAPEAETTAAPSDTRWRKEPKAKAPPQQRQEQPAPSNYVHTVRWPGETLSIIAAWYTGSIDTWKEVAAANPDINPDRIFVGNKILIPDNLIKTKEPMPQDFLWNFIAKPKKETAPSKPTAPPKKEPEREPELFGPKEFPRK